LSLRPPDATARAALAAFYKTSVRYAHQRETHGSAYFGRLRSVMDAVLANPDLRILEIGAGSAGALRTFLQLRPDAKAVALELSDSSLQRAIADMTRLRGVAGSALEIPLRDASVDAVMAFEVIEHLPGVAQALDEMLRVLRRPGHIIIGLPNHASLWTPVEDALRRRDRRAFGVERGRGAWRWWRRNAALAWRKRMSPRPAFLYRQPILDSAHGGDADAVYYAAPLDLMRFFESRGARLVTSSARVRFGPLGRLVPVELQGSTVLAWRVT
jgi:SAM-dependent methyltransferase